MNSRWGGVLQLYDEEEPEPEIEEEPEPEPEVTGTYFNENYDKSTGILTIDTDYPSWYIEFYDYTDMDVDMGSFYGDPGITEINVCEETGFSVLGVNNYIIWYIYDEDGNLI